MKLRFLGATETVTGSKYLLKTDNACIMVDCGLFQGYKPLRLRNWAPLPVRASTVNAIVLTHAHIDHSGYLPVMMRRGFKGKVYCTPATADLCHLLLPDAGYLQEEEADYANRHSFSKHAPAKPLYTRQDAVDSLNLLEPIAYSREFSLANGLRCTLSPSGHILGSSFVRITDGNKSILFSGDLGRPDDPMLMPPVAPTDSDYLVIESTYGNRLHPATSVLSELAQVINRTVQRNGVVVIPSFAVGRAQTLLYCIHQLKQRGEIPDVPVYLNSPMAINASSVYVHHHSNQLLDKNVLTDVMAGVQMVATADESRALNARKGPMIILSASGMATGGRVVHHLKAFAPDSKNTILFVGFQAGGTRGASLVGGAQSVRIHGQDVPIRAEVAVLDGLSAHADANEIMAWLKQFKHPPKKTFITHGEPAAADALRLRIERELTWPTHTPYYLEMCNL